MYQINQKNTKIAISRRSNGQIDLKTAHPLQKMKKKCEKTQHFWSFFKMTKDTVKMVLKVVFLFEASKKKFVSVRPPVILKIFNLADFYIAVFF